MIGRGVRLRVFWLVTLLLLAGGVRAAERIEVLTYHDHPPFVTGPQQGLTYELVDELNRLGGPALEFVVQRVPRARLNLYLQRWIAGDCPAPGCPDAWVVPWVSPQWGFIRGDRDPYLWYPLFEDANDIVSRSDQAIAYTSPESLVGKRLGGIRGHRYVGIDALVAQGRIERVDGNHERDNLVKLLRGRVDAVLLPSSTVRYLLVHDEGLKERAEAFHVAATKHQRYLRQVMIPGGRKDLLSVVKRLDGRWSSLPQLVSR